MQYLVAYLADLLVREKMKCVSRRDCCLLDRLLDVRAKHI